MTEYTLACRHEAQDTLKAYVDGDDIGIQAHRDSQFLMSVYQRPDKMRVFARSILALCDEVDGEEVPKSATVKIGDRVRILRPESSYNPEHRGSFGQLTATDHTECPYRVAVDDDGPIVWAYSVELASSPRGIKVGDRVRVTDDDGGNGPTRFEDREGLVKSVDPRDELPYLVEFGDGRGIHGNANGQWWCRSVELVDPQEPMNDAAGTAAPPADRASFLRQARELLDGQTYTAHDLISLADDLQR